MALDILNISFEFSSKVGTRQLPHFDRNYESNVKGLYVVGDLADAPVIKIALNQGYDICQKIFQRDFGGTVPRAQEGVVDLAIVGAGPAGIGAALAAQKSGLSFQLIEREKPFNTIQNFPKAKHIFSEPKDFGPSHRFPFMDASKEDLVVVWGKALDENRLEVRQPEEVTAAVKKGEFFELTVTAQEGAVFDGKPAKNGDKRTLLARRIILAIGRRGTVTKLGCTGESAERVQYALHDPDHHRGQKVLVVGGGDSAVEAALALAASGAVVAMSYRQDAFSRTKLLNKQRIEAAIASGSIKAFYKSRCQEVKEKSVLIATAQGEVELENDLVFALIGTQLPLPFLQKLGIRMEGALTFRRLSFVISFALATYLFYVIKTHKDFWPFGPDDFLGGVPQRLVVDLGWRAVDGSFWGTVIYSLLISIFGIRAIRKYRSPIQTRRYLSLIGFQLIFLFGIPEILAPLLIEKPWKLYTISVPWPLSIWSLAHGPTEAPWLVVGALVAFVAMPLFVRYHGERFCSWACGCGGLAETLGDEWRHLAPRGTTAKSVERFGWVILLAATVTTVVILGHDFWGFLSGETWTNTKVFMQKWYGLIVDFWFACVVGVAFYPYLGNRVWCRFLCPLRAYMELLAKAFGRLKIVANEKCIGCGECTRYCQMGIPVQKFAQLRQPLANHNSACIQCGICVEVCPMDVLSLTRGKGGTRSEARRSLPIVA